MGRHPPGEREERCGYTGNGTLNRECPRRPAKSPRDSGGEETAGAAGLEEALGKLLLLLFLPLPLLSREQQAETAPAGSCREEEREEEEEEEEEGGRRRRRRKEEEEGGGNTFITGGRRRRKEDDDDDDDDDDEGGRGDQTVEAVPSCGAAPGMDTRLGIAQGPWMLPELWKLELGEAWGSQPGNSSRRLFLGWIVYPGAVGGGRVGSGRAGSEASCLSS
ncbi:hypothetical protein HGM15179_008177 [Zosterops borbonicus]|uniref:Uncharacterized protein n=1 Tax=Zosterops borbonicus TaxID=364589 RepID=A0A8K1LLS4_9PASS|nr:hypothetical protein HGM15179_008177 [Zosterops borbonicus]